MFKLPELPYAYDALEPHIDAKTMEVHHSKHHKGYTDKTNAALEGQDFGNKSVEEILSDVDSIPAEIRQNVINNGGGFVNHKLFWTVMSPNGGGKPTGKLAEAIDKTFGGFDSFKEKFEDAAKTQFGSGWAWLVVDNAKKELQVTKTQNQDTPLSAKKTPILALDVWEHAYYLNYQNRRPDYISAFWNVVNWDEVSRRYEEAL